MKIIVKDDIEYIIDEFLFPFKVAISLKSESVNRGDMSYNFSENIKNRENLFKSLKICDKKLIRNKQIHSNYIVKADHNRVQEADGLISDKYEYVLMLLTADCYNLFFTTDGGRLFGSVHAGWKGISNGIIGKMKDNFKGETKVLIAQGICKEHFTVQNEIAKNFDKNFGPKWVERKENISVDLRGIINDELRNSGEIFNLHLCNVCNKDKLFSFRENDKKHRNLSLIWRDDE